MRHASVYAEYSEKELIQQLILTKEPSNYLFFAKMEDYHDENEFRFNL